MDFEHLDWAIFMLMKNAAYDGNKIGLLRLLHYLRVASVDNKIVAPQDVKYCHWLDKYLSDGH